ncbi:HAUS augmin-like complex subunit 1 [Syngnathus scovelli]|uniref:HAUS augmin-like complex subunit 1 n=1 Tax=Syngnathus scovelli TaxID=161590 RepID=UPI0021104202|nr:HAUS augmin-like complex subunit 1 [Syngnathus scovelli]
MSEKLQRVNRWLATVFGDEAVPQFEVTSRTVDILDQLAESSEARCLHGSLLAEDLNEKVAEYQAEAAHLQAILREDLGISLANLPKSCTDYLSSLVDSAVVLAVRDTSFSSLTLALNQLSNELLEEEKSETKLDRELLHLRKKLSAVLVLRGQLQEDVSKMHQEQMVVSAITEERQLNMDFIKAKTEEIQHRRETQEARLAARNMKESLSHQALVQLSAEVTELQAQIKDLKKELQPFMDLSPSPSLALVKIEEAKRELAALNTQLEKHVDFKSC